MQLYTIEYCLEKLQQESAEVIQSKIRIFGETSQHPNRNLTNKQELVGELEDLLAAIAALEHHKYFDLAKQY